MQAIRGTEKRAEAKWRKQGWELVSQDPGTLRTQMTFRRTKPKTLGTYLAQGYTAFRGLRPKTQRVVAAAVGGLLLVLVTGGIVAATLGDDDSADTASTPTATAAAPTQESAAPSTVTLEAAEESAEDTAAEEERAVAEPEPYTYAGPDYETVAVDEDVILGELDQHWVLVRSLDASAEDFEDQVKLIIADVAHEEGTAEISVSVVTDPEIAAYRSGVTGQGFVAEHGQDYVDQVVRPKEQAGYLAWYTGGVDPSSQELSESDAAYEVLWLPASDSPGLENWKPSLGAS
ncbi:hypothetical protein [Ornithinimicrobium avium]|uniref:hypothetical protein n=1 Tax=Ornithinimicrobium avium TaxID=2283195 RepID=UPI001D18854C|nr:hypothetical protein [Ornithinimicrobium avium]